MIEEALMVDRRMSKIRVGDTEILVEATPVPGSEPTSRAADAGQRALDALADAQRVIVEMARSTAATIEQASSRGARPDRAEVKFGLKISVKGDIILAGASGDASLQVTLTYEAHGE
jgi:hypothetical protein